MSISQSIFDAWANMSHCTAKILHSQDFVIQQLVFQPGIHTQMIREIMAKIFSIAGYNRLLGPSPPGTEERALKGQLNDIRLQLGKGPKPSQTTSTTTGAPQF